jgi:ArsR family metal-binding transcriptional regulator
MLVASFEITHVLPCLADARRIRFHARPSAEIGEVLPYLNATLSKAVYHHAAPALTFTREQRIICLRPRQVTGAKVDDLDDARAILDELKARINETWERRGEITPLFTRRAQLTPAPVFSLLPKTNCRACGLATCLAFAVELAAERISVLRCVPLFAAAHQEERQLLLELLAHAGYEVPSAFRVPAG